MLPQLSGIEHSKLWIRASRALLTMVSVLSQVQLMVFWMPSTFVLQRIFLTWPSTWLVSCLLVLKVSQIMQDRFFLILQWQNILNSAMLKERSLSTSMHCSMKQTFLLMYLNLPHKLTTSPHQLMFSFGSTNLWWALCLTTFKCPSLEKDSNLRSSFCSPRSRTTMVKMLHATVSFPSQELRAPSLSTSTPVTTVSHLVPLKLKAW